MLVADRYFSESPIDGDRIRLDGQEAHHLAHVMRAKLGDVVTVFDGSGVQCEARIDVVGRSSIELSVIAKTHIDRESAVRITLGVALPKGDRQKWLIEKAVELGVATLTPLETARSVAQPVPAAIQRLSRAVIEASKQCGRNRLMRIAQPERLRDFCATAPEGSSRMLAHPGGMPARDLLPPATRPDARSADPATYFAIGPEGGFTDEEVANAKTAGWQVVDLGPRILRVETAALLAASLALLSVQRG